MAIFIGINCFYYSSLRNCGNSHSELINVQQKLLPGKKINTATKIIHSWFRLWSFVVWIHHLIRIVQNRVLLIKSLIKKNNNMFKLRLFCVVRFENAHRDRIVVVQKKKKREQLGLATIRLTRIEKQWFTVLPNKGGLHIFDIQMLFTTFSLLVPRVSTFSVLFFFFLLWRLFDFRIWWDSAIGFVNEKENRLKKQRCKLEYLQNTWIHGLGLFLNRNIYIYIFKSKYKKKSEELLGF